MVLSNLLKTSQLQNKFGITKTLPYLCRAIQQSKSLTHGIDTGYRRLWIGVCISIDVPSSLYRGLMATSVRDVVVRFHPLLLTQNSNTWTKQLLTASNTSRRPMQVKSKRGVTPLPTPTTMYLW